MFWIWALLGLPVLVLFIRRFMRIPCQKKLLHTPYAQHDTLHYSKILIGRIYLAYEMVKHPRRLAYKMKSKVYEKLGLVPTSLENEMEQPKTLRDRASLDGMFFYGTDGSGTFLKVSLYRRFQRQAQVSLLFILPDGTTYELPNAPDTLISDIDGRENFNAGGIKFQLIEAMRKWRIVFNGLAKRVRDGEQSEVHLRINMIWTAFSRPYEIRQEFSRKLLAAAMAREMWRGRKEWWRMSQSNHDGVDQWGVMAGTFQEGSQDEEKELYLRGLRQRRWGQDYSSTLHRSVDIIGSCDSGHFFYITATSDSSRLTHEVSGHLCHPNGFLYTINKCSLDLEKFGEKGPIPDHFSLRFNANRHEYHNIIHLLPQHYEIFTGSPWRHQSTVYPCHSTTNARKGRVLLTTTYTYHGHCPLDAQVSTPYFAPPNRSLTSAEHEKIVLLFNEEACQFDELVGGKGSSLALMSCNSSKMPIDCTVPSGFCLTVNAWKRQVDGNEGVLLKLKELEDVGKGLIQGQLENSCKEASTLLASAPVDSYIQDCLREALQELFGDEAEKKQFAVRSSAIGEDGEDLSSAGQNATILGCRGYDAIVKGVQECWSSLLTYQSVEYRRQHGEPLIPGMGVVVQEMVDSEAAGVLFTVNPNDGDPSRMILTANFGLGESVVSGHAEPDTFILKRTSSGHISVSQRTIGSKHLKFVLTQDGSREEEMGSSNSATSCLSDEMALKLGQLGVFLEKSFGGPRDIEFGIRNDSVYLLQSRPVTSLDSWSDYELRHEFDTPILTNSEYIARYNVGEVVPGAMSPLSFLISLFEVAMVETYKTLLPSFEPNPWCLRMFVRHENHLFINLVDFIYRTVETEIKIENHISAFQLCGKIILDKTMHQIALQRYGTMNSLDRLKGPFRVFKYLRNGPKRMERALAKYSKYSFPVEMYTDAQKLYDDICSRLYFIKDASSEHTYASSYGSLYQMMALSLLFKDRKELTPEICTELGQFLSSVSDVESAGVPFELKELAIVISKTGYSKEFVEESTDDALKRLDNDQGPAGSLFRQFLVRHGHRGIMEFDFNADTWELDPRPLISSLQSMVANPSILTASSNKSDDEWHSLIQQKDAVTQRLLKFFISRARKGVVLREKSKSLLVRAVHHFRLAYRRLGELMVREGKIPDAGLVTFFTHSELQQVIHSRAAALINKAIRRRKLHSQLDTLVYPEACRGFPKAIQDTPDEGSYAGADGAQVVGTPVFKGIVRATVRVALNLEEARHIQCGEILIARCTDIGWSPYFPLVSGVVTELGGLISHGAVVAREYGLPCIVGAQNATRVFRTGDRVILDGAKGTITRVDDGNEDL